MPLDDPSFGLPPRSGEVFDVRLSAAEAAQALAYCRSMVGSGYDVLAMLGWAFRVRGLQSRHRVYCFELVYDGLAAAGVFPASKRLLTGDQLLVDLFEAGRVERLPGGTHARAAMQRQPAIVRAPRITI
ncbi:hypothetical protein GDI3553 [Gluconacetobacter diazotrophicus PA1 5]|uniref:Uncharacterized protein n=1 Tax=Gluconacetobacter diazotrophicus (strain ATCC 49037 / DSM 5601 / CCUG 37298 / CIP 103539 / LMG 7603 / PAl5) TaxID=272568 RepID=A9H6H4_GLUDA|nr:hypothetical protein GDI3553 [Gluconacetobacter diazotrophicus PA1 5]